LPKLVGDATTGRAGIEAMLDIETITGVAGNIESEFWGFGGVSPDDPENEPFMKWLTQLSKTSDADVPKLFSTSYGEDENSWSLAAATRLNTEFQKAGTRGITLLYASGDEGANCKSNKYVPETPSSSPYVTAVGGTQPASGFPSPGSESAIGLSSGGFSDYWPMPSWQKTAVAGYLSQSGLPAKTYGYNVSGRAYPDISAQATNFCVNPGGCGVAGTSCASPTAAAIFSLLNDLRLQNGQSTLGFLNPFIYENAAAFNDITTGSGEGCGFMSEGWPAKKGWDAVTGVGTPNYAKLAKIVTSLPAGRVHSTVVV
jgi:tripeptidyl-peptidase-1